MGTGPATELVQRELHRALKDARHCIERVEMALAMLNGFNTPVPQYEPRFRHLPFSTKAFELAGRRDTES
ncbi:MAG TPA: hypothetical protein VFS63_03700 [Pseudolabrys sp.]|jgi:hypothetical protein|nr:hypothetical protein [Pseudolabrys sp.]